MEYRFKEKLTFAIFVFSAGLTQVEVVLVHELIDLGGVPETALEGRIVHRTTRLWLKEYACAVCAVEVRYQVHILHLRKAIALSKIQMWRLYSQVLRQVCHCSWSCADIIKLLRSYSQPKSWTKKTSRVFNLSRTCTEFDIVFLFIILFSCPRHLCGDKFVMNRIRAEEGYCSIAKYTLIGLIILCHFLY